MAKRYRYAFAQQKQAEGGVYSVVLAVLSFVLFLAAVAVSFFGQEYVASQVVIGGISVGAALLAIYGFFMGMISFSAKDRIHSLCTAGAIANGLLMVGWLGLYLIGIA